MEQAAAALYAAHQVTSSRMVSNDAPLYSLQNVRKLMQVFQRYVMTMILPAPTCTSACVHRLTLNPHTHTHHRTRTHGSFAVQMLLGVHTHAPLGDVRHELAAPAGHRQRVGRQGRLAPSKRQHRPGSRCVVDIKPTQREDQRDTHSSVRHANSKVRTCSEPRAWQSSTSNAHVRIWPACSTRTATWSPKQCSRWDTTSTHRYVQPTALALAPWQPP